MLADLKTYMEITSAEYDTLLSMILEAQKTKADSYLGIKHFDVVAAKVAKFDGNAALFALGYANVSSVSVAVVADDVEEVIDSTHYVVNSERGLVKMRSGLLNAGRDGVEITFSGGYAEDNIPKDMRFALIKQSTYEFRRKKDPGLASVSFPDGSVSKFETDEWLPDVEKILNKYRRIWI